MAVRQYAGGVATIPHYPHSEHRLDNGLRVVISEDHLAPVVAVNVWYDVGSRHEVPGRTGFAHLFEHLMFQGSANVERGEHFSIVNAAGGTLNGTTWCDRTNYYETVPSHHLATGAVARGRPDGWAARRARPGRTSTTSATS